MKKTLLFVISFFVITVFVSCNDVSPKSDSTNSNSTVYPYHDGIVSNMKGTVTVTNADTNLTADVTVLVVMTNNEFVPYNITVPMGGRVKWTNADSGPHSVIADDGSFNLQQIVNGYYGYIRF